MVVKSAEVFRKMRRKLAVIFLVAAALTQTAIGVTAADGELTAEELRETNALAQLFVKRMTETNDVAVVVDELFVPDFIDRYLNGPESEPFIFIQPGLARRLPRDELLRYYVANINFRHLSDLYLYGKFGGDQKAEREHRYPPAISRLVNRVNANYETIENADEDTDAEVAAAVARLRASLDMLERVSGLLRGEVSGRKLSQSARYKKAVADWGERFKFYKPWLSACAEGCYGLPAGSRLFIVNVPSFQLKVALAGGGAKIVSAMPYFD